MRIDLHLHSTASDGTLTPAALARAAAGAGLDIIAITDHDTVAGVPDAMRAAADRVTVIPGIEISSTLGGADVHILGYFLDFEDPALLEYTLAAVNRRVERMHAMLRRLEAIGMRVTMEDVLAEGADAESLGRPHLARALVRHGYVQSVPEAFDRYLADGSPIYVPMELLAPRDAIELIHAAGGRAVWAHPEEEALERDLRYLVDAGLDGMECYRPRMTPEQVRRRVRLARKHGLLTTGGSDWHGGPAVIGEFSVSRAEVGDFLAAGGL